MKLTHSTKDIPRVLSIFNKGIVRPRDLNLARNYPQSDENHIYLSARTMKNITSEYLWGSFQFILSKEYVKANSTQFRVHSAYYYERFWRDSLTPEDYSVFYKFVEKMGFDEHCGKDVKIPYQIISTEPINPDGLESLVIPRSLFQEKEKSRIIRTLPKHMKLYVDNNDKVARIK